MNPRDVAVNPLDGKLYWTDGGDSGGFSTFDSVIRRSDPDGSNIETFLQSDVEDPRGIALDVDNGKMYWADAFDPEVARANLDGTGYEAIVSRANRPVDVALDPVNGKIYWADDGFSSAQIQRANLDGSNIEDVATGLSDAVSVAVDPSGGKVYWIGNDGSGMSLRRSDLDGANAETIVATVSTFARDLEIDLANAKLYWTVAGSEGIRVSNLDGSSEQQFLDTGSNSQATGLALVAPQAIAKQLVSSSTGSSPVTFPNTGVSIAFSNVTGTETVTVTRYGAPPQSTDGIPSDANVSRYRIVITIDGATIGSGTQVRFDTGSFPGISAPEDVQIYTRTTAVSGIFTDLTTTLDGTDLVVDVTGFSEFVFASTNDANTLPVELSAFRASPDGDVVRLQWTTATETNNAGFHVERSVNDGAFEALAFEPGVGTTTQATTYRLTDDALPFEARTVSYRLRQVDLDGAETLLSPVQVQLAAPADLTLQAAYPNPARAKVTLPFTVPTAGDVQIDVYNVLGQRVQTIQTRMAAAGGRTLVLPADNLASGVYFVRLTQNGDVRTQSFRVVK